MHNSNPNYVEGKSVYQEFAPCRFDPCQNETVECCTFDNQLEDKGRFCMTEYQKDGAWNGTYRDNLNNTWQWDCIVPPPLLPIVTLIIPDRYDDDFWFDWYIVGSYFFA